MTMMMMTIQNNSPPIDLKSGRIEASELPLVLSMPFSANPRPPKQMKIDLGGDKNGSSDILYCLPGND
jgi:hypothetical protein